VFNHRHLLHDGDTFLLLVTNAVTEIIDPAHKIRTKLIDRKASFVNFITCDQTSASACLNHVAFLSRQSCRGAGRPLAPNFNGSQWTGLDPRFRNSIRFASSGAKNWNLDNSCLDLLGTHKLSHPSPWRYSFWSRGDDCGCSRSAIAARCRVSAALLNRDCGTLRMLVVVARLVADRYFRSLFLHDLF
jgi:hypothetical protein